MKKVLALVLSAVLMVSLVACGGGQDENAVDKNSDESYIGI